MSTIISRPLLVGLCGPAGCGKDTVAYLLKRHGEFTRYSLAKPIKLGLEAMLGVPLQVWEDREKKEAIIWDLGKSPRQLAQTLGTEWGRQLVHPEIWTTLMVREWDRVRQSRIPRMVVTDVRFDNEAEAIRSLGGTVWQVVREDLPPVAAHASEAGVCPQLITGVVNNTKSKEDLDTTVQRFLNRLVWGPQ